jgi:ABC-type nitrate/sulfonate/bicarbonate transport system substrate-binding protein
VTEQLLEAIATGKADAGIGMALHWLKPFEAGFDARSTAGLHGLHPLLGFKSANIDSLELLRRKSIAISDQASPAKNFFLIVLAKRGIDPVQDVERRHYQPTCFRLLSIMGRCTRSPTSIPHQSIAQGRQAQRDRDQPIR